MAMVDKVDDEPSLNMQDVLQVAGALGERLTQLGDDSDIDAEGLLKELAEAQQELQIAWDIMRPQYDELATIIDDQRADHWWQRKLIATLPVAVLETEPDGRIIWANSAAATMFDRPVLRLVRTRIQKFVHEEDDANVASLLTSFDQGGAPSAESTLNMATVIGGPMSVELVPNVRKDSGGHRTVLTWVLQPVNDRGALNESRIAHAFGGLCMLPLRAGSLQELLSEMARLCEDVCVPNSSVSVTIGPPAEPEHLASSTVFAQKVDAAQMLADEGPCQEAWETGEIVYSDNATADARWPKFAVTADGTGMASALAAPIRVGDEILGVLNVYSKDVGAFQPGGMRVIELLAESAGAVIHHVGEEKQLRELVTQLEDAMRSREVIEQAKGVLMVQYRCSADEAVARLAKVSQNRNIRMRVVAQTLIDSISGASGS